MKYSNTMDDVYNNINNYSPKKSRKILIVFDGMTASTSNNKKDSVYSQRTAYSMQKTEYISYFCHTILPSCSKRS